MFGHLISGCGSHFVNVVVMSAMLIKGGTHVSSKKCSLFVYFHSVHKLTIVSCMYQISSCFVACLS